MSGLKDHDCCEGDTARGAINLLQTSGFCIEHCLGGCPMCTPHPGAERLVFMLGFVIFLARFEMVLRSKTSSTWSYNSKQIN